MIRPEFFTAFYAAVVAVEDGYVNAAEIQFDECVGELQQTLTVTIRKHDHFLPIDEMNEPIEDTAE
jgi:hypothetical protein